LRTSKGTARAKSLKKTPELWLLHLLAKVSFSSFLTPTRLGGYNYGEAE
jgi:hypothetical protein